MPALPTMPVFVKVSPSRVKVSPTERLARNAHPAAFSQTVEVDPYSVTVRESVFCTAVVTVWVSWLMFFEPPSPATSRRTTSSQAGRISAPDARIADDDASSSAICMSRSAAHGKRTPSRMRASQEAFAVSH